MIPTSLAAVFAVLAMTAIAPSHAATAPLIAQAAPKPGDAIFLFGRTRYFHTLVKKRHCEALDKAAFDAANARYEKVRQQLMARYGEKFFDPDVPDTTPIPEGMCDSMTLASYSHHISEIEQFLSRPG